MTEKEKAFHVANHTAQAAHHVALADHMKKSSDAHAALSEHTAMTDPGASEQHKALSECHKSAATSHVQAADHHLACCKTVVDMSTSEIQGSGGSSSDVRELANQVSTLVKYLADPTNRVSPNPNSAAPRPNLVPRFGAQPAQDANAVAKVVPELRHLIHDEAEAL